MHICQPEVTNTLHVLYEIHPKPLKNPKGYTDDQPRYLGQGSFEIVKHQQYRDYDVAVKEFRDHTKHTDVHEEALDCLKYPSPMYPICFACAQKWSYSS